jgi:anti-sigma regulatory factor (Ser/Thr protein kinase)
MNAHDDARRDRDADGRAGNIAVERDPMDHRPSDSLAMTVETTSVWSTRRAELQRWVSDRIGRRSSQDVLLACGEAVDNAFEHGQTPVTIELTCAPKDGLEIVVRDRGKWRVRSTAPPRGLGLPIMTSLMDNVAIDTTDGTVVRLSLGLKAQKGS